MQAVLLCGMADTDQIKPALTATEWADKVIYNVQSDESVGSRIHVWLDIRETDGYLCTANDNGEGAYNMELPPERCAAVVALANHALPDDDPRKITRAHIDALMECVKFTGGPEADKAEELAKILTALLPP